MKITPIDHMRIFTLGLEAGRIIKERDFVGNTAEIRKKIKAHVKAAQEAGIPLASVTPWTA